MTCNIIWEFSLLLSTGMRLWTESILQFGNPELQKLHAVRKERKITKLQIIDIVRAFWINILHQCSIDLKGEKPLLLVSVYMPCRGLSENIEDFSDCLDQLSEIEAKYNGSHNIVLGGDMNEDMVLRDHTVRAQLLKSFVKDSLLDTKHTSQTYSNPEGVLVSTLDYIFYSKDFTEKVTQHKCLESLQTSVYDHLPVLCQMQYELDKVPKADTCVNLKPSSNVRWDKLDRELYKTKLSLAVQHVDTNIDTVGALNNSVMKLNETLDNCARSAAPS